MIRVLLPLLLLFSAALSGCQGSTQFEAAMPVDDGSAVVYIYRPKATNPGKQPLRFSYPEMLANGKPMGVLKYNEHLLLELPLGEVEFVATGLTGNGNWEPRDVSYKMTLEAGKTYYLRLRVAFDVDHMTIGNMTGQYLIHLHQVDPGEAPYEIRETSLAR